MMLVDSVTVDQQRRFIHLEYALAVLIASRLLALRVELDYEEPMTRRTKSFRSPLEIRSAGMSLVLRAFSGFFFLDFSNGRPALARRTKGDRGKGGTLMEGAAPPAVALCCTAVDASLDYGTQPIPNFHCRKGGARRSSRDRTTVMASPSPGI